MNTHGFADQDLEQVLVDALRRAVVDLPADVEKALRLAAEAETDNLARGQLTTILANTQCARSGGLPLCQDTGTPTFFVTAGTQSPYLERVRQAIPSAVEAATQSIPLRPNAVHPFSGVNSGTNTGRGIPIIDWTLVEGDEILIRFLPKGGGSENACGLFMLSPNDGLPGASHVIIEHVRRFVPRACPPVVIGIGLGGGADSAIRLAKRSLLRSLGTHHETPEAAVFEHDLLLSINTVGIGPMGLGGRTTALAVHVEWAHRHPASFPVGVAVQCWADRRAGLRILANGKIEEIA